jgi:hypothetical protein
VAAVSYSVDHSQKVGRKDAAHEEYHTNAIGEGKQGEGNQHKYDFSVWVAPGDKLSLNPKAPAGSDLLFYPSSASFTLYVSVPVALMLARVVCLLTLNV